MDLVRTRNIAGRVEWRDSAGSTNDVLVEAATASPAEWPHLSVVVTDTQTGGKGRLGRSWVTPPGTALAVSVLVRPRIPIDAYGWLALIAGTAMATAVREAGAEATVKWPNDVLIGDRKVAGVLAELLPDLGGAVIGVGVNTSMSAEQLPVPTATSLTVEGARVDADALLATYLGDLASRISSLEAAGGDAVRSGQRDEIAAGCSTIGRSVRIILPAGDDVVGQAVGLEGDGRLQIVSRDDVALSVAAGDVTHLRY